MAWWTEARQIANPDKSPSGKWRMTATSDEDGGGPFGNRDCFHASASDAEACDACDEYVSRVSGFPSRKVRAEQERAGELADLERLQAKYGATP